MVSENEVMASLKKVLDPELGINIVDLGLIYGIEVLGEKVNVKMTLTFPGCPLASYICGNAKEEVEKIPGIKEVAIQLVFEPAWTPDRISEDAKKILGI